MSNHKASIQLRNVRVNLGNYREFGPISMRIWQGNWFGLIAPPGAGKSLLIKTIVGLFEPDYGSRSIVMGIDENKKVIPFEKEQINSGLVRYLRGAESYELDEKVVTFLRNRAKLRGYSGNKLNIVVEEVLENFWLEQIAHRRFKTLQRGIRRRVAIAEKFIGNPAFVVIDDPFWGTEDFQARNILECMKNYTEREDIGVLLSSRNTKEVAELVDYMVELGESGNLMYNGSIDDWVEKRASAVVYKIIARGKGGDILNLLRKIKGVYDILWYEGGAYNCYDVYMKDDKALLERIFHLFYQAKFPIIELSPQSNPSVVKKFNTRKKILKKPEFSQEIKDSNEKLPDILIKSEEKESVLRKNKEDETKLEKLKLVEEETKEIPPLRFYFNNKKLEQLKAEYEDALDDEFGENDDVNDEKNVGENSTDKEIEEGNAKDERNNK